MMSLYSVYRSICTAPFFELRSLVDEPIEPNTFLLEFGPWEHVDLTLKIGAVNFKMKAYLRVQSTELINVGPQPEKGAP